MDAQSGGRDRLQCVIQPALEGTQRPSADGLIEAQFVGLPGRPACGATSPTHVDNQPRSGSSGLTSAGARAAWTAWRDKLLCTKWWWDQQLLQSIGAAAGVVEVVAIDWSVHPLPGDRFRSWCVVWQVSIASSACWRRLRVSSSLVETAASSHSSVGDARLTRAL
jgi:hypothetical protein